MPPTAGARDDCETRSSRDLLGWPTGKWLGVLGVLGALSLAFVVDRVWRTSWHHVDLDFSVYMMGAHHLTDGQLYIARLGISPHLPFTYPPFAALAFSPLDALSLQGGQLAWAFVGLVALFSILALSLHALRPALPHRLVLLWSVVLLAPAYMIEPVRLTFAFGQVNLVLAALALADLTCTCGSVDGPFREASWSARSRRSSSSHSSLRPTCL